jgi:hypothetical protein
VEAAGRKPGEIGLEPRIQYGEADPNAWQSTLAGWQAAGAAYAAVNTMGRGLDAAGHIRAIRHFAGEMMSG